MAKASRLFPLYLTPLEQYMYYEHRQRYPMTFVNQVQFAGEPDRTAMDAALEEVIERHSMLTAVVQRAKRKRLCWVASKVTPEIDYGPWDQPLACPGGEAIDITKQIGLRLWFRYGDGKSELTVQNHHACADGIAAQRFLAELLAAYGMRTVEPGAEKPRLGELDPGLLRDRFRLTSGRVFRTSRTALTMHNLRFAAEFFGSFNCTLQRPAEAKRRAVEDFEFPGIASYDFNRNEFQAIRDAALKRGVTMNDLLLALLFKTAYEWNAQRGNWNAGRKLRILMPCDLRGKEGYELPAANFTSLTFLTRRATSCGDVEGLLLGIRNETAQIKHNGRDTDFSDGLASAVPYRLLPLMVIGERCLATVVLTNLGDPTRRFTAQFPRKRGTVIAGNLRMDGFTGVPPMRPKTRGAFAVFTYRRFLRLCLRADPNYFCLADSAELLQLYAKQIREFVQLEADSQE